MPYDVMNRCPDWRDYDEDPDFGLPEAQDRDDESAESIDSSDYSLVGWLQ